MMEDNIGSYWAVDATGISQAKKRLMIRNG